MSSWKRQSSREQLFEFLLGELKRGRWGRRLPGVHALSAEFRVNRKTVEAALGRLEKRGWLENLGPGKRRLIVRPVDDTPPALRIAILHFSRSDIGGGYMIDLNHRLEEAGHTVLTAERTLEELGMDKKRIRKVVLDIPAEAWIVIGGSRPVLEWFSKQPFPMLAMFGRRRGIEVAAVGPDKPPVLAEVVRRLIGLGHRRIILFSRRERRKPYPGTTESAMLDEMEAHGIETSDFNLPDWEENADGFEDCLKRLFMITPPTALILDEAAFYTAALLFLAEKGLRIPHDVSLFCCDPDPTFAFCKPAVSHLFWDPEPVIDRIVRWAENVAEGRVDEEQIDTKAEYLAGGTIGPCV